MHSKTVALFLAVLAVLVALLVAGTAAERAAGATGVAQGGISKLIFLSKIYGFDMEKMLGDTANINEYVDHAIPGIVNFMVRNDLDPMPLPDLREGFSYKPLLIEYRGEILLHDGLLHNCASLKRTGDSMVSYFAKLLRIRIEAGFTDLEYVYKYKTQLMDIGPTGGAYGSMRYLDIIVDFLFDFTNDELHLQWFEFSNVGRINVRLTGNILTDWFMTPVTATVVFLFNGPIVSYVEDTFRGVLIEQTAALNRVIKEVMTGLE